MCLCAKSYLTSEQIVQGGAVTRAVSRIRRQTPHHSPHAYCRDTHTHAHICSQTNLERHQRTQHKREHVREYRPVQLNREEKKRVEIIQHPQAIVVT